MTGKAHMGITVACIALATLAIAYNITVTQSTDSSGAVVSIADHPQTVVLSALVLLILGDTIRARSAAAKMQRQLASARADAATDRLTGIANRQRTNEELQRAIARSERDGTMTALVLLDLDHFKSLNDTYGHPAGDAVLTEVARRIQGACRDGDLAGRWGGEEFAVVLHDTERERAAHAAERIRNAIAEFPISVMTSGGKELGLHVTTSVGVATTSGELSVGQLYKLADERLYNAKTAGRNCVVCDTATLQVA